MAAYECVKCDGNCFECIYPDCLASMERILLFEKKEVFGKSVNGYEVVKAGYTRPRNGSEGRTTSDRRRKNRSGKKKRVPGAV